jgi:hypothetical protein
LKYIFKNLCVELIPTATGNGYPKCNYYANSTYTKTIFGIPLFAFDRMPMREK